MEDQPADSGDLTTEADAEAKTEAGTEPEAEKEADAEKEAVADTDEAVADETVADETVAEPVLVPHRPPGRGVKVAAVAGAAVFVAAAAFAAANAAPYLTDRALVQVKLDIAGTAADAISTLWTYTPEDMETLPDRAAKFLGGDFQAEYRKYIDAIAAPNKQAQVSNNTQVLGAAVESLDTDSASAIVYTNSVATSPVTKNIPSLRYLSYRLTMEKRGTDWLITQMNAITSLDLTPRL
ncbi:mammalian cell entry protein [Mycobacterium frederiksbergense]|uniref:mammalian cell entry protein n=1 Tax=Mycolicibacterium frederiksbergense TaxID=117567 RepID=UPI0021F361DF|nr:mammalian cell entry protein [Mycolicibacterium frederiksbergense]MCV7044776.1 mammalian cell entry protein [Mycolicibacterium frederiksbergense]